MLLLESVSSWRPLNGVTAAQLTSNLDAPSIIKAQVLAGGRGKGHFDSDGKGGVRLVESYVLIKCNAIPGL